MENINHQTPWEVAEIKLTYNVKVKPSQRSQIDTSEKALPSDFRKGSLGNPVLKSNLKAAHFNKQISNLVLEEFTHYLPA